MMRPWLVSIAAGLTAAAVAESAGAQSVSAHAPRAAVAAVRVTRAPVIDGRLDDEAWQGVAAATDFTQQDPDEGQPATERTEIRITYDDVAVYVAARMYDREPSLIARRLSSRDDDSDADFLDFYLDPMHDHLTGAGFQISAAGVQRDAVLYNDSWDDSSWDSVWESAVSVDDQGWTAELRIPLSQLRFTFGERQTWGVNAMRFIRRKNERAWLELVPKNESGRASRMAHLTGLDGLRPKRHLALLPYTAARAEFVQPERVGNPFNDGSRAFMAAGIDLKWGVTSNLTLDGTVNPDFGQVEVDPAVVNLTQFETFFPEKRPFFLEGAQIFGNFGESGANNFWGFNTSDPEIFYSRRIGRTPQVSPSGRIHRSAGRDDDSRGREAHRQDAERVEHRTAQRRHRPRDRAHPVGGDPRRRDRRAAHQLPGDAHAARLRPPRRRRLSRDCRVPAAGHARDARQPRLERLRPRRRRATGSSTPIASGWSSASWPGAGFRARPPRLRARSERLSAIFSGPTRRTSRSIRRGPRSTASTGGSTSTATAACCTSTPRSGASALASSRTTSAFSRTGDRFGGHAVVMWRDVTPGKIVREWNAWAAKWWTFNFNRERQGDGMNSNSWVQFSNYWNVNGGFGIFREVLDDRLTRGGPSVDPAGRDPLEHQPQFRPAAPAVDLDRLRPVAERRRRLELERTPVAQHQAVAAADDFHRAGVERERDHRAVRPIGRR